METRTQTPLMKATIAAMKKTRYPEKLWWRDPLVSNVLTAARSLGWVRRHSVTQIEWTETGAALARSVLDEENRKEAMSR